MKNKIISMAVILAILLMIFTGCKNNSIGNYNHAEQLIGKNLLENFHINRLKEKESPYTMCYENNDGTASLYIFTSPIAYYDDNDELHSMDTTLVSTNNKEMKKKGYKYEIKNSDTKSYFPKNLKKTPFLIQGKDKTFSFSPSSEFIDNNVKKGIYIDILERNHISTLYQEKGNIYMEYIPTISGIMANITINQRPESNHLSFYIDKQENLDYFIIDNQYVMFKTNEIENAIKAIIYTSFLQDSAGAINFNTDILIESEEEKWKYTIVLDEEFLSNQNTQYPLNISPSFDLYRNKTPDSTIYSNKPLTNMHLSDYTVIGNNDYFGYSQHYLQFNINYVFKSYEQNIKSASYVPTVLSNDTSSMQLSMFRLKNMWRSSSINWDTEYKTYEIENVNKVSSIGQHEFDITDFVKSCVKDDTWNTESNGFVIAAADDSTGMSIIATNDNSFYQPYVRIDFYDLPWKFEKIYSINPDTINK